MSNVENNPVEQTMCSATTAVATEPDCELLSPREVPLGGPRAMRVRRVLPNRDRHMVGAWCFADSYGPADITGQTGMQVPPHPHIGLQTVSWLVAGEVLHQDSLNRRELIHPGELPLMTAGRGIAHSEQSPPRHSPMLHGAQLWVALPEHARTVAPAFEFYTELPRHESRHGTVTVLVGELDGAVSPATTYTPLVGASVTLTAGSELTLPLAGQFEHGVLVLSANITVAEQPVDTGELIYLGRGRSQVSLSAETSAQALLLGGEPFAEDLVMWWNFVGRTHDDIVAARTTWQREHDTKAPQQQFGPVDGYAGPALPAPALPNMRLKARSRYHPRH